MQVEVNMEAVKKFMERENLTINGLAIKMGMTPSNVYRIFNGERKPGGKFQCGLISIGMNPKDIFLTSHPPKNKK